MWFTLALVSSLSVVSISSTAIAVELGDYQLYRKGYYSAFAAPFNKGTLTSPRDFINRITLAEETFPAGSIISWKWPSPACPSVCGFLQVSFGDYLGGTSEIYVPPRKIKDISNLEVEHHIEIGGDLPGFNVIYDLFLSKQPHTTQLMELEILLHSSPSAKNFATEGKTLGILTAAGYMWRVTRQGEVILLLPFGGGDVMAGRLDLLPIFKFLKEKGILSGDEYFHGLALGAEPREGGGRLKILSFSATFK